ncbi:hypothetical protein T10_4857 [Trichinella papuae]|uniref:PiggyBac transposable element-derived protein domain-containing protein n=1 Tax=Trichinella papuae TaxID=268474 RepID=A0A0V1MXP9_9BILA|nr:hypothetical protein T10_4857 [Trichinella papuae]
MLLFICFALRQYHANNMEECITITRQTAKHVRLDNMLIVRPLHRIGNAGFVTVAELSTQRTDCTILDEANNYKPAVIFYYNQCKSALEMLDKMVKEYSIRQGSRWWPVVLFMNIFDIAALNVFIIYSIHLALVKRRID